MTPALGWAVVPTGEVVVGNPPSTQAQPPVPEVGGEEEAVAAGEPLKIPLRTQYHFKRLVFVKLSFTNSCFHTRLSLGP